MLTVGLCLIIIRILVIAEVIRMNFPTDTFSTSYKIGIQRLLCPAAGSSLGRTPRPDPRFCFLIPIVEQLQIGFFSCRRNAGHWCCAYITHILLFFHRLVNFVVRIEIRMIFFG